MMNEPNIPKRKNKSPLRVIVNAWGCLLGVIMLGAGLLVGFAGAVFFAPVILGYNETATAQAEFATRLAITQQAQQQRDNDLQLRESGLLIDTTNQAMQAQGTREALDYSGVLLDQTATQSQQRIFATQTASVAQSNQLRTEIANNATATQNTIFQQATNAAQQFRLTEDALNNQSGRNNDESRVVVAQAQATLTPTSTQLLLPSDTPTQNPVAVSNFAAQAAATNTPTDAPVPNGIIPPPSDTPIHTPTSSQFEAQSLRPTNTAPVMDNNTVLFPPTNTPTPVPMTLDEPFTLEWLQSTDWQTNTDDAWAEAEALEGVSVERANAWLLYNTVYSVPYRVNFTVAPAIVLESEYFLIFGLDENEGYAAYMFNEGLAAKRLALYRFDRRLLDDQLDITLMEELTSLDLDMLLRSETTLSLIVDDGQVTLSINEQSLLLEPLDDALSAGQIGMQVPQGAILQRLTISVDEIPIG